MPRRSSFEVDDVIREGQYYGWEYVDYQWSQGELVILEKHDQNGDRLKINIWCTTGTVGTYLKHPRQGKTQARAHAHPTREPCAVLQGTRLTHR